MMGLVENDESMRKLILEIARTLVDDSDAVSVEIHDEGGLPTLRLHVANSDTGKIIGKQGRTARSLRTILTAAGMKLHRRYSLDIQQEIGPCSTTKSESSI
jgi:predicted RNA-binding protein YlqC (UPF0109 family)